MLHKSQHHSVNFSPSTSLFVQVIFFYTAFFSYIKQVKDVTFLCLEDDVLAAAATVLRWTGLLCQCALCGTKLSPPFVQALKEVAAVRVSQCLPSRLTEPGVGLGRSVVIED